MEFSNNELSDILIAVELRVQDLKFNKIGTDLCHNQEQNLRRISIKIREKLKLYIEKET